MARTTTRGTWHERIDHRASLGRGEHHATPLALKRGWSRQSTWNCCQLERTKRPELETRVAALEAMAGLGTGLGHTLTCRHSRPRNVQRTSGRNQQSPHRLPRPRQGGKSVPGAGGYMYMQLRVSSPYVIVHLR